MKFKCKVATRSSRSEIIGLDNLDISTCNAKNGDSSKGNLPSLKIYLTSAPVGGKANKELIELLSKKLKCSKSRINIIKGRRSREKIIEIDE